MPRHWLQLVTVVLLVYRAAASAAPLAYITNSDDTVSVIDTQRNSVIATVPVGHAPMAVAVNDAGTRVYIANHDDSSISVIDAASNTVITTIDLLAGLGSLRLQRQPVNRQIVLADTEPTPTPTPAPPQPLGSEPRGLAVDPTDTRLYVAGSGAVLVIDLSTDQVDQMVVLPEQLNEARALAIDSSGTRLYAGYDNRPFGGPSMDGHIVVIDTTSLAVVSDILLEPPYALALDSTGSALYATSNGFSTGGHVSAIDTATDVLREFPLGPMVGFGGLAVAPDASRVYVAAAAVLLVVDPVTGSVIDEVRVGGTPIGVALTPAGDRIYVANFSDNTVSAINTATNSVIATVPVGVGPVALGQFIGPAVIGCGTACSGSACFDPDGEAGLCFLGPGGICGCVSDVTPTWTPTPTLTATPTPQELCIGDCNLDGNVHLDELISLVNIALAMPGAPTCPHGVPAGAGVDVALIIRAVNNALLGCSGATPTATPTRICGDVCDGRPCGVTCSDGRFSGGFCELDTPDGCVCIVECRATATPTDTVTPTPTPTSHVELMTQTYLVSGTVDSQPGTGELMLTFESHGLNLVNYTAVLNMSVPGLPVGVQGSGRFQFSTLYRTLDVFLILSVSGYGDAVVSGELHDLMSNSIPPDSIPSFSVGPSPTITFNTITRVSS